MKRKNDLFRMQVTDWLLVALGLAIFAAIVTYTITKSSIWFDESFGAYLIRFNFIDIARYTAVDVHPPFYYWLLKIWSFLFGNTELGLRSMSLFFGVISIMFGYLLTNRSFGRRAARFSLLFMILSPIFIRYSQEARMYTLVTAIALAATYVLMVAMKNNKRSLWVVYGILISLGMWTHYFSAVVWIAHWFWRAYVIKMEIRKKESVKSFFSKEWIMAHCIAAGLFLPWMPFLFSQLHVVQAYGFWIPPVTPNTITNYLTNVLFYQDADKLSGWLALGFVIALAGLVYLALRVQNILKADEKKSYALFAAVAFIPVGLLVIFSLPPLRPSFVDRYLITSAFVTSIFIGVTLAQSSKFIKSKYTNIFAAFVAAMMVIGIGYVYYWGNFNKDTGSSNNTRQIIEAVKKKSVGKQPMIAASPWLFYEAVFYSTENNPVYYIAPSEYKYGSLEMLKENDFSKIKDIDSFVKDNPVFWYVIYSGETKIDNPCSGCEEIQRLSITNPFDGKVNYQAIEYENIGN